MGSGAELREGSEQDLTQDGISLSLGATLSDHSLHQLDHELSEAPIT